MMEMNSMAEALEWFRTEGWKTNTFPQQVSTLPNDGYQILQPIAMGEEEEFQPRLHNPANQTPLLHCHDEFVMLYMYEGECRSFINETPVLLKTGDVLILSPHVMHSNALLSKTDIMFHCKISKSLLCHALLPMLSDDVLFSSFIISFLANQTSDEYLYFSDAGKDAGIRNAFETLIYAYIQRQLFQKTYIRCLLATFFTLLGMQREKEHDAELKEEGKLKEVLNYICKNYSHITLKKVAAEFHYHPNYLSSIIKKQTGKTFSELIGSYRLSRAYYLLMNTELGTDEIASAVGYRDLSSFYRAYKKFFGTTPRNRI